MDNNRQAIEQCIAWFLRERNRLWSYLHSHAFCISDAELVLDKTLDSLLTSVEKGTLATDDDSLLRYTMRCLYRAGLNELDAYRRRQQREKIFFQREYPAPFVPHTLSEDIDDEQYKARCAVYSLPEHLREVLMLHIWQELSFTQTADILGLPVSTVKSRFVSALQQVEQIIKSNNRHGTPE